MTDTEPTPWPDPQCLVPGCDQPPADDDALCPHHLARYHAWQNAQ